MLKAAIEALSSLPEWNVTAIHDCLIQLAQKLEVKNGTLLWPVRIAAAGMQVTPGGAMEILAISGQRGSSAPAGTGPCQAVKNAYFCWF